MNITETKKNFFERNALDMDMQEGAVTLLDVLGWKGIWQRKPDAMEVLDNAIEIMEILQKEAINQLKNINESERKIRFFSDTIILTTHGKPEVVLPLHVKTTENFLGICFLNNLPIRGAIGYGKFSSMKNMLIGPAVDEVASWYEAVEWMGAILTPTASFHYQGENYPADSLLEYCVPLTKGGKYRMKCLNWFYGTTRGEKDLLNRFLQTASVLTPDVAPKYLNTVEFFRYIQTLKESKRKEGK